MKTILIIIISLCLFGDTENTKIIDWEKPVIDVYEDINFDYNVKPPEVYLKIFFDIQTNELIISYGKEELRMIIPNGEILEALKEKAGK